MRLRNDTKLDFNSISGLEADEMMKRIVDHMNLFIEDVSQVLGNIDVSNLAGGSVKSYTVNSGRDSILSTTGFNAIVLESSNAITSQTISQKSSGLVINVVTSNGNSTTLKILLLKVG